MKLAAVGLLILVITAVGWHLLSPYVQEHMYYEALKRKCPEDFPVYEPAKFTHFDQITLNYMGAGFGPHFEIVIHGNGLVEYEGLGDYVKTKGRVAASLKQDQIERLVSAINDAGYFSIPEGIPTRNREPSRCFINASEQDKFVTSVTIDGKAHWIEHIGGRPPEQLQDFENAILAIINIDQWIGTAKEREKLIPTFQ